MNTLITKAMQNLQIEIFSDVICPWCFIGKRRLDSVLASEIGEDVDLRWRPYQLYPNTPLAGTDRIEMLRARYGPDADLGRTPARIAEEAAMEGIELRYDLVSRTPNTLLAHRLMEFAFPQGSQHALAEALFMAYFCQGKDVGQVDELVQIGESVGLDADASRSYLAGDGNLVAVQEQLARAPELGISGVPGYYLADSFLLPGAQTAEVMGQIIQRVKTRILARQTS